MVVESSYVRGSIKPLRAYLQPLRCLLGVAGCAGRDLTLPKGRRRSGGPLSAGAAVFHRVQFHAAVDSLNSRFLPLADLATDAVFAVDDDIRVPCADLEFAFAAWAQQQHALVGFYPRLHVPVDENNEATQRPKLRGGGAAASGTAGDEAGGAAAEEARTYAYHSWWYVWWSGRYSMVLTKAALLHRRYLSLYSLTIYSLIL